MIEQQTTHYYIWFGFWRIKYSFLCWYSLYSLNNTFNWFSGEKNSTSPIECEGWRRHSWKRLINNVFWSDIAHPHSLATVAVVCGIGRHLKSLWAQMIYFESVTKCFEKPLLNNYTETFYYIKAIQRNVQSLNN